MKKQNAILLLASLTTVSVLAFLETFGISWMWSQSRDVAEYLPVLPKSPGLAIISSEAHVYNQFAACQFMFRTTTSVDGAPAAARLFESQLASDGWEMIGAASSERVASSYWRHKRKLEGGLHLAFTVIRLYPDGSYLGTMVTVPYWGRQ